MHTLVEIKADGVNAVTDPGILGGTVVFKGSRFPVRILLANLEDGMSLDQFHEVYEAVPRDKVLTYLKSINWPL